MEEYEETEISESDWSGREVNELTERLHLATSISRAFANASPTALRKWYVDTFLMDKGYNLTLLPKLGGHIRLEQSHAERDWSSTEHAAVGNRLLFLIKPDMVAKAPDLLEPNAWRNEFSVTDTILRLFRPWERIRFDPQSENWYHAIRPGQWKRNGKGAPSQNVVEGWIRSWLDQMPPSEHPELYEAFPPDLEGLEMDEITARTMAVLGGFNKYKNESFTMGRIRATLERALIMHLDSSTLNQIRTMAPFNNGAVALVETSYLTTDNKRVKILPGTLKPLDIEYMVTNANTLPWLDKGQITEAFDDINADQGDFWKLDELQDNLLLYHCPTYWSFLTHAFPEPEERSAFLRLLGAAMYGTNLKIVAAMIGEPNAGKDTVINWLSYLMPGQVAALPFSAFTPYGDEDRGFASLLGARVAVVSGEVGEGRGSKLLAEKIKIVSSGGGMLRVAEKYEKPTTIFYDGMLFLQGNSVPQIAGGDRALYMNRIVAIEFKHPFKLISQSFEAQYRHEAPHFAQVLFINYLQYNANGGGMTGINPPLTWREFGKEFADSSNQQGWLENCIVPSQTGIPTSQFHAAMSAMSQRFGSPYPVAGTMWPKTLRKLGFQTKGPGSIRKQVYTAGKPVWCYFLTLDSEKSDGMFTQDQWKRILQDAAVTV